MLTEGMAGERRQAVPGGPLASQRGKTLSCALYGEIFPGYYERHAHYLSIHTAPLLTMPKRTIKTYPCALCDDTFQTTKERRAHYQDLHTINLTGEIRVVSRNLCPVR